MKKYILLSFLLFTINLSFAQGPPGPGDTCPCCEELIDVNTGLPFPGSEADYATCTSECTAGNNPCVPIDSGLLILLALGTSFGIFKVYKNKKSQFEN